ncbi:MAG: hypothetical protein ACRDRO_20230 [Pseudonocardiaceae bacterium]
MPSAHDLTLNHHTSTEAARIMDELCEVYADAYGVEPDGEKTAAFRVRAAKALGRPRYGLLTAQDETQIVGFVFGYTLPAGTYPARLVLRISRSTSSMCCRCGTAVNKPSTARQAHARACFAATAPTLSAAR